MPKRLIAQRDEKSSLLLKELLQEIENRQRDNRYFNMPITKRLSMDVGVFHSVNTLGCYNSRLHKISLNVDLINKGTEQQIKDVLVHELIHACGIHNHKWQFKNMAWKIQNVLRYDALADISHVLPKKAPRAERAKYKLTCTGCGQVLYRIRKTDVVKYADRYRCSICKHKFTVEEL